MVKHLSTGLPESIGKIEKVTGNAEEILPDTDLFIIAVPAIAHRYYFEEMKKIKNRLKDKMTFGVMVAEGGVDWEVKAILGDVLEEKNLTFFGMETLPWACRSPALG